MLDSLLPQIQKLISEKATGALKAQGDKAIFKGVYTILPGAVRLMVKEETFVDFCVTNSHKLFDDKTKAKKPSAKALKKPVKKVSKPAKKAAAKKK